MEVCRLFDVVSVMEREEVKSRPTYFQIAVSARFLLGTLTSLK